MISTSGIQSIPVYGSAAQYYRQFPTEDQVAAGVVPLDSLPAEWWNAMWYCYSCRWNETRSAVNSLVDEVCNAIACSGIALNSGCNSQLYQAIKQYGTADQAGAVKSSSTDGKVSIDSNGIMSLNGYGNAALQTTAQTLTGAINELKERIDNFVGVVYSDTAPLVDGTAAAGTCATVARGDHVHPIGCCIKCADSGHYIRVGVTSNTICATSSQGYNTVRSCGYNGYNLLMADGRQGHNLLYAEGYNQLCTGSCLGYNLLRAEGCCGYNSLYTCGCNGYNQMSATGANGYNQLIACCNRLTAGLWNIICTEHASCDTYTCIYTLGHEANLGFYTCGSSEAHFSHHVTAGQVHVYSCAEAVGSEGTHIICTSYTQGCLAYIRTSASNSDSSISVCSHNYSNRANTQAHWAYDYNPEITEEGPSYTIKAESHRTRACCWCADCNCWSRWSPRIYLCASGSDTPPAAGTHSSGVATLEMLATRPDNLYTAGDGETLDGNRLEQVGIACLYGNKLHIGVGPIPAASCCCATPASCYNVGDEVVIDLNQWMVPNNCTYPPTLQVRGGAVTAIHHLNAVCVKYCCTGTCSTSCYCYDLYIRAHGSTGIGAYANYDCLRFFNMQRSILWPVPAQGTGWTFSGTCTTGPASISGTCTLEKGLMMYDAW